MKNQLNLFDLLPTFEQLTKLINYILKKSTQTKSEKLRMGGPRDSRATAYIIGHQSLNHLF